MKNIWQADYSSKRWAPDSHLTGPMDDLVKGCANHISAQLFPALTAISLREIEENAHADPLDRAILL